MSAFVCRHVICLHLPCVSPIYVGMHIHVVPNRGSPPTVLLRESYREGSKVGKRTLANLSSLSARADRGHSRGAARRGCAAGRAGASRSPLAPAWPCASRRRWPCSAWALARCSPPSPAASATWCWPWWPRASWRPHTKLATTRWWHTTTLAEDFGVADANEDDLYAAMDWLLGRQDRDPEEARRAPPERRRPGAVRPVLQLLRGQLLPAGQAGLQPRRQEAACCRSTTACSPMRAAARWRCRCTRAMWPTARPCCPRCSGCARTSASSSW